MGLNDVQTSIKRSLEKKDEKELLVFIVFNNETEAICKHLIGACR